MLVKVDVLLHVVVLIKSAYNYYALLLDIIFIISRCYVVAMFIGCT